MAGQEDVTLGEVYRLCERIAEKVDSINGRVGRHDTRIAVLEDRGTQAKDTHARYAGWVGSAGSAALFLWEFFRK